MGVISFFKDKITAEVKRRLALKMEGIGQEIVAIAREIVPVKTGKLRDSIGYTINQSTLTLTIYADMPYSIFVELGTSRQPARPFLRSALIRVKGGSSAGRKMNAVVQYGGPGGASNIKRF